MDPKQTVQDWTTGTTGAPHYREWVERGGFPVRVELAPWLDAWAQGDRFGAVERLGRDWAHIRMDRSGTVRRIPRDGFTIL